MHLGLFYSNHPIKPDAIPSVPRQLAQILIQIHKERPSWEISVLTYGKSELSDIECLSIGKKSNYYINRLRLKLGIPEIKLSHRKVKRYLKRYTPDVIIAVKSIDINLLRKAGFMGPILYSIRSIPSKGIGNPEKIASSINEANHIIVESWALYRLLFKKVQHIGFIPPVSRIFCAANNNWFHFSKRQNNIRKQFSTSEKDKLVIFVGGNNAKKGFRVITEAVQNLNSDQIENKFHLIIVGNVKKQETVSSPLIHYTGKLQPEELGNLFASCDIGVVPSVAFDAGPSVLLEMAVSGLVLVGSKLGGIPEIFELTGGVIVKNPNDFEEWKTAIRKGSSITPPPKEKLEKICQLFSIRENTRLWINHIERLANRNKKTNGK